MVPPARLSTPTTAPVMDAALQQVALTVVPEARARITMPPTTSRARGEAAHKFRAAIAFCLDVVDETKHRYLLIPSLTLREKCENCDAILWKEEKSNDVSPCCNKGKYKIKSVQWLDMFDMQVAHGQYGQHAGASRCDRLQFRHDVDAYIRLFYSPEFLDASRKINLLFSFTSVGVTEVPLTAGPPSFKIRGQMVHNLGSYRPKDALPPSFAQVYVLDSTNQDDVRSARASNMAFSNAQKQVIKFIQAFMLRHNHFCKT
ncbi:hypothetical protein AaE_015636 [Aphanomyces astaci]|uniref:Helitron helicase-like domain-containing protein n=1 Tax=Aphanomyces astaci TaxID=112090 RepID=A0A6A4YWK8_APHAT|nr:hypothetical protein AaE_015636 [Aphanomyces astaci]